MDELRIQLERRRATLRRLSCPSPILESVLARGAALETSEEPWSAGERRLMGLLSRLVRFRRAHCYENAQQAVLTTSRLRVVTPRYTLEYWEGFAHVASPAPFAHGWCVLNGRVWDPSLDHLGMGTRYLGLEIPLEFLHGVQGIGRTYAPLLPRWIEHLAGVHPAPVEQTARALSTRDPRGRLAGAPSRM